MRSISPAIIFVGAVILSGQTGGETIHAAGTWLAIGTFTAWLVLFVSDDLYPKLIAKKND